jgi:hypothetical protein
VTHDAPTPATKAASNPDSFKGRLKTWKRLRDKGFGKEHAFQRFRDHYGFNPTFDEWAAAITSIREGKALLVARQSNDTEVWATEIRGISVRLIFNRTTGRLVTTNPPDRKSIRRRSAVE